MKLAILGGSFNPLHIGHAMLADVIVRELMYDKVLFIPTFNPPHKEITAKIRTEQRVEMVRRFCESVGGGQFELDTCEVDRGGISYSVDTLNYIIDKYKGQLEGKPALLMGEEIAAEFSKWKQPEVVAEKSDLIIVPRYPDFYGKASSEGKNIPKGDYCGDFKAVFNRAKFKYPHRYLEIPILTVSSTEIRARVASNKSYKYLVPKVIYEYIEEEKLYR
ncbi:MAG: nicotinate (nicotinamide) nucleotide adenylyltransferase [Treponema sp.]|nr:nicotinate (nicotinamide) nucleotide adenylyltransferase [Treponema sp.]